jgi:hypothetical protein
MTSALEGGEWTASRPGRNLPPGKTRYPLHRRLGGPQGRSGQVRKISLPPGFDPRTVQSVGSRYTDWATRPTYLAGNLTYSDVSDIIIASHLLGSVLPSRKSPTLLDRTNYPPLNVTSLQHRTLEFNFITKDVSHSIRLSFVFQMY